MKSLIRPKKDAARAWPSAARRFPPSSRAATTDTDPGAGGFRLRRPCKGTAHMHSPGTTSSAGSRAPTARSSSIPLTRSADLLDPETARKSSREYSATRQSSFRRGYLLEPEEKLRLYRAAYLDFLDRKGRKRGPDLLRAVVRLQFRLPVLLPGGVCTTTGRT